MAARKNPAADSTAPPTQAPSGVVLSRGSAFQGVRGQAPARRILAAALRNGRLAHGWLFVGPTGVGKELLARRLAAALMCTGRSPDQPIDEVCGSCSSCARVDRGLHPDVRLCISEAEAVKRGLMPWDEERKPSPEIKVEQIRSLREALRMTAFEGGWRVAILPHADRLRVEAGNALLKTLEEPLPRTLIMLCAPEKGAVLETLRSRCQRVNFAPLSLEDLAALLRERRSLDPQSALALAREAGGSAARAMEGEPGAAHAAWESAREWLAALESAPPAALLDRAEGLEGEGLAQAILSFARLVHAEAEGLLGKAPTDGAAALRARKLMQLAGEALNLRTELMRPGANLRLGLERFMLRAQGFTNSSMNS